MTSSIIILNTMTQCIKAQKYLTGLRINSNVERITGSRGKSDCGYGVRVYENPRNVCRLLGNIGLVCRDIIDN